eukprot:COSAG06_NODE_507_length_14929_cov_109.047067_5_plen_48_part_00
MLQADSKLLTIRSQGRVATCFSFVSLTNPSVPKFLGVIEQALADGML